MEEMPPSGLHELEPIPTHTNSHDDASSIDNETLHSPRTTTTGLGLSQHSALWYLTRIQKYSSYIFTAFAAMHITNTSIVPLITQSVPASEPSLLLTRPYYQSSIAEPLMVALPLCSHILSGIATRLLRRKQNASRYGDDDDEEEEEEEEGDDDTNHRRKNRATFFTRQFWPHVSGTSKLGYVFMPLALGHLVWSRAIPQARARSGRGNVELAYVSHAFARHPVVAFAGFAALVGVGCWHMTWGHAQYWGWRAGQGTGSGGTRGVWEEKAKETTKKGRRWYVINAIAAAVTGLWMLGSFGVVARGGQAPGWVGREYDAMHRMMPVVGRWM